MDKHYLLYKCRDCGSIVKMLDKDAYPRGYDPSVACERQGKTSLLHDCGKHVTACVGSSGVTDFVGVRTE